MAKISKELWSNGQNFDHNHGQNPNFLWLKWSTQNFTSKFNHKNTPSVHDHAQNANFLWSKW